MCVKIEHLAWLIYSDGGAQVVFQKPQQEHFQQDKAQMYARNDASAPVLVEAQKEEHKEQIAKKPYQFLLVSRLREYLALEFDMHAPFPIDPERIYDDFGAPSALCMCALWTAALPAKGKFCSSWRLT